MSTLNFPAITPNASDWLLQYNSQSYVSPLTGVTQTQVLPGAKWTASLTFPPLKDPNARRMRAFLASLEGAAGSFYLTPHGYTRAGDGTGTPLVKGAAQLGSSLLIDGCTPNITGWLLEGDFLQVGSELKIVTADCNSSAGGEVTVSFKPPLRVSPADNAAIVVNSPACVMRLADDKQSRWGATPGVLYGMALACEEVIGI